MKALTPFFMKAETLIGKIDPDQRRCFESCRHRHKDKMYHYIAKNQGD